MPDPAHPARPPLRVLQSFPTPQPNRNPYTALLAGSLEAEDGVELRLFTWRTALLSSYDVFHAHWPETRLQGSTPVKALVFQALYALLLLKVKLRRVALVRTVHNLELPQGLSRRQRALLRLTDRMTTLRITLNTSTTLPDGQPFEVILHGHYRDWYAGHDKPEATPGRVAFVGLVRRYKGVDALVRALRGSSRPDLSLVVAGSPSTPELAASLEAEADGDARVELRLRQLDDAEFVAVVCGSSVVALPYREMHNSAGALTALSLDRPVLVPRNEVNGRLADEVGRGWVQMYDGVLTAGDLEAAVDAGAQQTGRPDLTARDWSRCGPAHLAAYRRAVALARPISAGRA